MPKAKPKSRSRAKARPKGVPAKGTVRLATLVDGHTEVSTFTDGKLVKK